MAISAGSMKSKIEQAFLAAGFKMCNENNKALLAICEGIVKEIKENAVVYDGICKDGGPIKEGKIE